MHNSLKPTKWKVVLALVPFIFPLVQSFVALELRYNFSPLSVDLFIETPITIIALIETFTAQPFGFILRSLGWWSSNGIFVAPDGPLLSGSFAVAIVYAALIYLLLSLASYLRQKRKL